MNQKGFFALTLLLSTGLGFLGGMLADFTSKEPAVEDSLPPETSSDSSYEDAWSVAAPSVVSIVATNDLGELYGLSNLELISGSGFIVSEDGLVMTNRHVVLDEDADYTVLLQDGTELSAKVVARDSLNDIALLKLDEEGKGDFSVMDFADSEQVQVGEPVMAIGNALGQYATTSTAGIISATGRQLIAVGGGQAENLVDLLQTDAAINPGNSGGPLVNLKGEVVGMNTAIASGGEGIGFAIPSNELQQVLESYEEFGRIVRPFIGVRYVMVNEGIKERFKLDEDYGALVIGDSEEGFPAILPDSPAEAADLEEEDVILEVDGKEINSQYSLTAALAQHAVGEEVVLKIWRDGETLELEVKLEEREE